MDNERQLPASALNALAGGPRDLDSAAGLAESLGRLVVFAGVYQAEHVRVTSLATPLADAIAARATDDAPCSFELVPDGLVVDDEELPATSVATRRLRRDLDLLGVCQVDFFRTVTPDDLVAFAGIIRSSTRRETGRRTFAEPALLALPPSIAARFNDFGTPEFGTQAQGEAWVGEAHAPATPADADAEPATPEVEEDWRRLSRMLVTELLTNRASDASLAAMNAPAPGAAGVGPEVRGTGAGEGDGTEDDTGGARGDGAAAANGTATAPDEARGRNGRARKQGRGPAGRSGASDTTRALHTFAALLGAAPADHPSDVGGAIGRDGTGGGAPGGAPGGAGGAASAAVHGAAPGGKGRDGRSAGRKRSGSPTPGIAPEDGIRARGSRERLRALEEAVRRAIERSLSANGEVRSVTHIVEEARHLLPLVDPDLPIDDVLVGIREALDEHLRDAFRTESGATFDKARRPARDPVACKLELPELIARIDAVVTAGERGKSGPPAVDTAEQLSICLHLLEEDRRPGVVDGITRRLFARLSRALDPEEVAVMGGWIESLCAPSRGHRLVDRLLPVLFDQMRRASPATVLAVLLVALQRPRPALLRALWPHLAADMLHGCEGATEETREHAVALLGEVEPGVLASESERFSALVVGREDVSTRFLTPPRRRMSAFYEVVLGLPDTPALARRIIDGYRRAPPPNSAARALIAIHVDGSARTFLRRVLREELDGGETESLRRMAAGIVAASLRTLKREERRVTWAVEAIAALGVLRCSLAEQILDEILRTRRFLFVKAWPLVCRRAARGAKEKLADAPVAGGAR